MQVSKKNISCSQNISLKKEVLIVFSRHLQRHWNHKGKTCIQISQQFWQTLLLLYWLFNTEDYGCSFVAKFNNWLLHNQQLTFVFSTTDFCIFSKLNSSIQQIAFVFKKEFTYLADWVYIQQLTFTYLTIGIYIQQEVNTLVSLGKG